jgi:hypothetical protein
MTLRTDRRNMDWRSDPATLAQLRFLEKLGSTAQPETKGAASELIDRLLGGKRHRSRNPIVKLHVVKDVNQRVDDAAERAKKELHENTTSRYRWPQSAPEATSTTPGYVGLSPGSWRKR